MALRNGTVKNQYDYSDGINISVPGHLILDTEVFANPLSYTGSINCYWDAGIKKRLGTLKVNTNPIGLALNDGFRFYRSTAPTISTFVTGDTTYTKLLYLYGDSFREIPTLKRIKKDSVTTFAKWKDNCYVACGDTLIMRISYTTLWTVATITGLNYMPSYIVQHKDRLWAAGGNMPVGYLENSSYEADSSWSSGTAGGEAFNIGFKDGDPITGLVPLGNNLIVYKNDSIWTMNGDNQNNWFQEKKNQNIGSCAPRSIVNIGNGHIFLSSDNIYYYDGNTVTPIGNKIKPWLDLIPITMRKYACATYFNNYYRIAFARSYTTTYNDFELILDLKQFKDGKISWWCNDKRNISNYIPYDGPDDTNILYYCDGSNGYLQKIDDGSKDNGDSVSMQLHSKYYTFKQPNIMKIFDRLKIDTSSGIGTLNIEIIKNLNNEYSKIYSIVTTGSTSTYLKAILGTTYYSGQDITRQTKEIALPSNFDGYAIAYQYSHTTTESGVVIYGTTISSALKAY